MDPFVEISYNNKKYRSMTHKNGGKFPSWNQTFEIEIDSAQDDLSFTIFDENVLSKDFICQSFIKASALCMNNGVRDWFSLLYKQQQAGQILLETQFLPFQSKQEFKQQNISVEEQNMARQRLEEEQLKGVGSKSYFTESGVGASSSYTRDVTGTSEFQLPSTGQSEKERQIFQGEPYK
ncbi:hypothetical protein FGO68_gene9817 [Halteria grandinella]|uniref:C2 domain-containing protein n=1 Tax=Halteria grandinella TaxID=5974 RepID=A0A8J8SZC9_HALGN|nr:hypothetical protein FGO68_gene9817 [Halteria grandinella]